MSWYKIVAPETHIGTGTNEVQVIYMWESNISRVMQRYKHLGGVPRTEIPEIRELNPNEISKLEEAIVRDWKWRIQTAKKLMVRYRSKGDKLPPV